MTHSTSSNNKLQGKVAIITGGASGMGEATPIIAIVIAASISLIPLSFLVVGCFDCWWLVDFGWWWEVDWVLGVRFGMSMRFGMVSNRVVGVRLCCGCEICGCGGVSLVLLLILVVVFVWGFFFFLVAVADIGGRWLICGCGRWLWAVAVDLRCGLLLMIMWEGIIYYFNM